MRTQDSRLAKFMHPREKTCVPIRVILHFLELCYANIHGVSFLDGGVNSTPGTVSFLNTEYNTNSVLVYNFKRTFHLKFVSMAVSRHKN